MRCQVAASPITRVFPIYFFIQDLGLLNSYVGRIFAYVGFSLPFAVLLLRGYFETSRRRAAAWSMSTPSWPHAAIAILPALVLFVFVQRWLVGGLTAGSVKT